MKIISSFFKKQKGFTLSELLIAVLIGLVVLIVVGSAFILNQKVIRKSNTKAELIQNARITLDLMAREIRQAKEVVTVLPPDSSNPELIAHELQFEDGHTNYQIQYIRYYLDGTDLKKQIIVHYFETNPSIYVEWDDVDAFGPPESEVLEDKLIAENFSSINFFGAENIHIEMTLLKKNEGVKIESIINPRNI